MKSNLVRYRHSSYIAQSGRCYYCEFPLWEKNQNSFARALNISTTKTDHLKCTAEHLIARQDGGKDSRQNIVAACLRCNLLRHRMNPPPSPDAYRALVRKRVKQGKWHKKAVSGIQLGVA